MTAAATVPLEIEEHLTLCDWLNKHGVFFLHIPNEGKRSIQQAVLLKRMGMRKGAPDFVIPGPENIALELKRARIAGKAGATSSPSRVSKEQSECLMEFNKRGWTTQVCYGAAEAIGFLQGRRLHTTPLKRIDVL